MAEGTFRIVAIMGSSYHKYAQNITDTIKLRRPEIYKEIEKIVVGIRGGRQSK